MRLRCCVGTVVPPPICLPVTIVTILVAQAKMHCEVLTLSSMNRMRCRITCNKVQVGYDYNIMHYIRYQYKSRYY